MPAGCDAVKFRGAAAAADPRDCETFRISNTLDVAELKSIRNNALVWTTDSGQKRRAPGSPADPRPARLPPLQGHRAFRGIPASDREQRNAATLGGRTLGSDTK